MCMIEIGIISEIPILLGRRDMEHEKTCFFIGHREANERVLPALEQAVAQLIVEGNKKAQPGGDADSAAALPSI